MIVFRFSPLKIIFEFGSLFTFPALCVRRFHDMGKSGRFVLIPYLSIFICIAILFNVPMAENIELFVMCVPLGLFVAMWIIMLSKGSEGDNKYGKKILFDEDIEKQQKHKKQLAIVSFLAVSLLSFNTFVNDVEFVKLEKISDGDTIKVLLNGKKESVRLLDIDCFETSKNKRAVWQSEYYHLSMGDIIKKGNYSKDKLIDLLKNHNQVGLKWKKRDKYKRILGYIYLNDGTNVNQYMLENGGCMEYVDRHNAKK